MTGGEITVIATDALLAAGAFALGGVLAWRRRPASTRPRKYQVVLTRAQELPSSAVLSVQYGTPAELNAAAQGKRPTIQVLSIRGRRTRLGAQWTALRYRLRPGVAAQVRRTPPPLYRFTLPGSGPDRPAS